MSHDFRRVLALSPHTDDVELGCGGSLTKWIEEGKEVFYAAFSIAEKSVPEGLPSNVLEQEVKAATKALGIAQENVYIYKFEVRRFPQFRQEILELLVNLGEKLKPELVLLPSLKDVHQDHHTVAEEGIRAFKYVNIWCYELSWNLSNFAPSAFVYLEKKHLDKKVQAIQCYKSQKHRNYVNEEFLCGLARTRGVQVNAEYAEAFEIVRMVVK